jgi:uncharacterized protein (DUF849 family)
MRDIILTAAVTGNITRPEQTPWLPITPQQIAEDVIASAKAGAAIAHIHVRDPETGRPSMEVAHYAEVVARIRDAGCDIVLNLTTGPGGRFVPDRDNPRLAAEGTSLLPPLARVPHITALKPEICTLDLNTMNSGEQVVINTPANTAIMADAMLAVGSKPEIEIFNPGDLVLARDLMRSRSFPEPAMFSFVLGLKYGWPASVESILLGKAMLPEDAVWTAFGVGASSFPMVALSVLTGGHVRVGLEDNIYQSKGILAEGNAPLCEKARRIVEDLGYPLATPARAREMLGLPAL